MEMSQSVTEFLAKHPNWLSEVELLRETLLQFPFEENIKWGAPVYSIEGKNLIGIGTFKNYVGLWFFQGVFLKDEQQVLQNAQEGKTKAMRQWRFSSIDEIDVQLVKAYVNETIANHKAGMEVKVERNTAFEMPKELKKELDDNVGLKDQFYRLTPGKQKEYANYILEAKREATKQSRIAKITPMILEGVGLNDRYRNY